MEEGKPGSGAGCVEYNHSWHTTIQIVSLEVLRDGCTMDKGPYHATPRRASWAVRFDPHVGKQVGCQAVPASK